MYIITGATGNTGSVIAENLLKSSKEVTVISRNAEKVKHLTDLGAIAAVGDLEDSKFVAEVFKNATTVYAMIPPNFATQDFFAYQKRVVDNLFEALKNSSATHVVTLSSLGAHSGETGAIAGAHYLENKFKDLTHLNVLHLRAGFFFTNLFNDVHLLKSAGIFGGAMKGDLKAAMVHPADIAAEAVKHLLSNDFKGQSYTYVAGPEDLTFSEVGKIIGKAIGKPELEYVQFPKDQVKAGMIQAGLTDSLANAYITMADAMNKGILNEDYKRKPEFATPSKIEDFVNNEWLKAYQS